MADYIQFIIGILICIAFILSGVKPLRRRQNAVAPNMFGERGWRRTLTVRGVFLVLFGGLGIFGAILSLIYGPV